jgi:hypothetical protein
LIPRLWSIGDAPGVTSLRASGPRRRGRSLHRLITALTATEDILPVTLRAALESAADLARAEKATATKRAYRSDFEIFRAWCAAQGLCARPAEPAAVAAFIAAEAARGIKCATLGRRVAGIRHAHKLAGLTSPTDDERVKAVMRGVRLKLPGMAMARSPRAGDPTTMPIPDSIEAHRAAGSQLSGLTGCGCTSLGVGISAPRVIFEHPPGRSLEGTVLQAGPHWLDRVES